MSGGSGSPSRALVGMRVLIVDDEPLVSDAASAILALHGATVTIAATAERAIALARALGPDLDVVLLDLKLPDASGESVLDALDELGCPAAVVLTSGVDADEARRVAAHARAPSVLPKPFDAESLVRAVLDAGAAAGRVP